MVDNYILDNIIDRIKEIVGIGEYDNTKILIDTDDKLLEDATFNNVVILIKCIIKDDGKFYSQLFLEEALFLKLTWETIQAEYKLVRTFGMEGFGKVCLI